MAGGEWDPREVSPQKVDLSFFSFLFPSTTTQHTMPPDEDEEEDYMSMVIEEPTQKETFTQRKRREQREVQALETNSRYTRTDRSLV